MKIDNVKRILSKYDENFNIDEIRDKRDLLFYLDCIKMREE